MHAEREGNDMTSPEGPTSLTDEDIDTTWRGTATAVTDPQDADGTDGGDADGTDSGDGDATDLTDGDATDGADADGQDA